MNAAGGTSGALAARRAAVEALLRVNLHGAYLHLAMRPILRRHRLGGRQAALASALAAGALRWLRRLDFALGRVSRRSLERLHPKLLQILRVAAFEVGFSRAVPAPVACDLAVTLASELHPGAAAFANGVLRALVREGEGHLPTPRHGPLDERLAVAYSHPTWLVRRWLNRFGVQQTEALLAANNEPVPLVVRANLLRTDRQTLIDRWARAGASASPDPWLPEAVQVDHSEVSVDRLPGFEEGWFTPQSLAAMLVGRVVHPRPGELLVDLCAAPGGKSTHLAELAGDRAAIVAGERHPRRAGLIRAQARRLGLSSVRVVVADAGRPVVRAAGADGVLLDAPCTDLGIVGRHPEVRYRRTPEDLDRAAALQRRLLEAASALVAPGGRLVYSVCSFEPEETTDPAAWFLGQFEAFRLEDAWGFVPDPLVAPLAGPSGGLEGSSLEPGRPGWITLLPHRHRTDGFFVVRFRRIR